uniref:Uncharacterized protein n=4 Tax=Oryza TaxID=4527 RepID=A0A0E0GMA6_ORYNI
MVGPWTPKLGFFSPEAIIYIALAPRVLLPPSNAAAAAALFGLASLLREIQSLLWCLLHPPPPCRTRRVRWWTSTSPGSARPRTGSSPPRTTPRSRSTLGMWMRMGCTMAASPPLLSLGSSVLREMLTVLWIGCGRRGRLRSSSSRSCY